MDDRETHDSELGERYRAMLQGYYERLAAERAEKKASVAIEEVKLRLFLSLLDKPRRDEGDREAFSGSPS